MSTDFLFYLVDNERYLVDGVIRFAEGSGDNREEWFMRVLRHEKSGEICYLDLDTGKRVAHLHWAPEENLRPPSPEEYLSLESHQVDLLEGDEIFARSPEYLEYIELFHTEFSEGSWGIFDGTERALLLSDEEVLFSRRIFQERENIFYSDIFPAEEIDRVSQPRLEVSGLGQQLFLLAFVGLLVTGIIDIFTLLRPMGPDFSTIFFYGGLASSVSLFFLNRSSFLYAAARMWGASFALYICTALLDNHAYSTNPAGFRTFVLWHMLLSTAIIGGLRIFWRRGFAILAEGAFTSMVWIMIIHGSGIFIYSCIDEYWWGGEFFWYAGATPFGHAYTLFFLIWTMVKFRDYLHVPMTQEGFIKQIQALQEVLRRGPSTEASQNKKDAEICDDLADAVDICPDPQVASLEPLMSQLRDLTKVIEGYPKNIAEIEMEPDVQEDLNILIKDLQELADQLNTKQPVQTLRISPFLRAVTFEE